MDVLGHIVGIKGVSYRMDVLVFGWKNVGYRVYDAQSTTTTLARVPNASYLCNGLLRRQQLNSPGSLTYPPTRVTTDLACVVWSRALSADGRGCGMRGTEVAYGLRSWYGMRGTEAAYDLRLWFGML
eukprot:1957999-Rhodomonas_salina.1